MEKRILIAGSGGQGVMVCGKELAVTASKTEGIAVTYFPAYGVEQRGGTANCHVTISDKRIGSPLSKEMDDLIVMNDMSLDRFLPELNRGGRLFSNGDVVRKLATREVIEVVSVPAGSIADEIQNPKGANLVMLGAYIGYTDILPAENVSQTLKEELGAKKPEYAEKNEQAFRKGFEIGKKAAEVTA